MDDWELGDDELRALGLLAPNAGTSAGTAGAADMASPFPNVHELFRHYNQLYFESKLGFTSVEWSTGRMTLCAGICMFSPAGGCRIRLSEPLLKYRPVKDLKETLLHEMIHAYMFLEGIRDHDDHGPKFKAKMNAINVSHAPDHERPPEGYAIDTHHTMIDEVNLHRVHWWECARCKHTIKRSMNRRPQPADCRGRMGRGDACQDPYCHYHTHLRGCGGEYVKIKGPDLDAAAAGKPPPGKGGGGRKRGAGVEGARGAGKAGGAGSRGISDGAGGSGNVGPVTGGRSAGGTGKGAGDGELPREAKGAGAGDQVEAGGRKRGRSDGGKPAGAGGASTPITQFFQVQGKAGAGSATCPAVQPTGPGAASRDNDAGPSTSHRSTGEAAGGSTGLHPPSESGKTRAAPAVPAAGIESAGDDTAQTAEEEGPPVDAAELRRRCMEAALQRLGGSRGAVGSSTSSGIGQAVSGAGGSSGRPGNTQPQGMVGARSTSLAQLPASAPVTATAKRAPSPTVPVATHQQQLQGRTAGSQAQGSLQQPEVASLQPPVVDAPRAATKQIEPEVIWLDCSQEEPEADAGPAAAAGLGSGIPPAVNVSMGHRSNTQPASARQQQQREQQAPVLTCPVCCQTWAAGSITYAQLNAHVDECIQRC